jgi:hypothetical protein
LDQGSQHSLHFVHLSSQQIKLCGRQKVEIAGQQQVIFELRSGTTGDVQIPRPSDRRPVPYAMFAPIEEAARRIWDVIPNNSSLGNSLVAL